MNPPRRTIRFNLDLPGVPDLLWKVEVSATCPTCTKAVDVASTDTGALAISCPTCKMDTVLNEVTYESAMRAIFEYAARTCG
jgi:hypothetical protein